MSIYLKHGKFYSKENHQALTKEHVVEAIVQMEEKLAERENALERLVSATVSTDTGGEAEIEFFDESEDIGTKILEIVSEED